MRYTKMKFDFRPGILYRPIESKSVEFFEGFELVLDMKVDVDNNSVLETYITPGGNIHTIEYEYDSYEKSFEGFEVIR